MRKNIIIPETKISRKTIYLDESGIPIIETNKPQNFQYFILTGVIANNDEFTNLEPYYYLLKTKYFSNNKLIHSSQFFKNPTKNERKYIKELSLFLDSIPFYSFTVIINKKKIVSKAKRISPRNPFSTNLHKIKSIWNEEGKANIDFQNITIKNALELINNHKFININNLYPLQISFRKILEQYINEYTVKVDKKRYSQIEICFESSPFRKNILTEIEKYTLEIDSKTKKKTDFSESISKVLFNISFPNKNAKYMGLEIADLISYGYYLKMRKVLTKNRYFDDIWRIIKKKEKEFEKLGLKSTLSI